MKGVLPNLWRMKRKTITLLLTEKSEEFLLSLCLLATNTQVLNTQHMRGCNQPLQQQEARGIQRHFSTCNLHLSLLFLSV